MPKPIRSLIAGIAVLVLAIPALSAADSRWQMRDRIFCDDGWGISFRYPYDYQIPDQYQAALRNGRAGVAVPVVQPGKRLTPQQIQEMMKQQMQAARTAWHVRGFCFEKNNISSDLGDLTGKDLPGIAAQIINGTWKLKLAFEVSDYYEAGNAARPQADPAWAPSGLVALKPKAGGTHCGWFIDAGDRYVGVLCGGAAADPANAGILNSFEVLADHKNEKRVTWRHAQLLQGKAIDGTGAPIAAKSYRGKTPAVAWSDGWNVETRHYHLHVHSSPQRALYFADYLEKVYEAFIAVYQPDDLPPYKMEIKIMQNQRDFMTGAGSIGVPVGPTVGGFFMPGQLAIFAYEDSEKVGGKDFAVEHVLAHECSHQFLHCTCNGSDHVPTWLNEGMAVYFESAKYINGKFGWFPPKDRLDYLRMIYNQNRSPLQGMEFYMNHYGQIPGACYGEVYAILHFFVFGQPGNRSKGIPSGKERFKTYWNALKEGENGTEAFQRIFMDDMIKAQGSLGAAMQLFDEKLLEYVKSDRPYQQ